MDIFKLRELTAKEMDASERDQVSKYVNNLVDNIRDTLKERKGREDKIESISESISQTCPTELGVKLEFTIKRKNLTKIVIISLVPSTQKILFSAYSPNKLDEPSRGDYPLTIKGSRESAIKVIDLIDFEKCFDKEEKKAS